MVNHPNRSKRRRHGGQPQLARMIKVALHSRAGELDHRLVLLREDDDKDGRALDEINAAVIGLIDATGALHVGDRITVEELAREDCPLG